jgi:hypothetical protein
MLHLVHLDLLELLDRQEVLDLLELLALQDRLVLLEQSVLQDHLDKMVVLEALHLHIVTIQINQQMIQEQVN